MRGIIIWILFALADTAAGAAPDLMHAEPLVREGNYREAYDLLAPFAEAQAGEISFNCLLAQLQFDRDPCERAERLLAPRCSIPA